MSAHWRMMLQVAYREAMASPDPSTQNGALALDALGNIIARASNNFPRGTYVDLSVVDRETKYLYVEHAERNCLYQALSLGRRVHTLVCPWAACVECARAIVQSGVHTLVRHQLASDRSPARWVESIALADEILRNGGVDIVSYKDPILVPGLQIRHCGEVWQP